MENIQKLAKEIRSNLLRNIPLEDQKDVLARYIGTDWKCYARFCDERYTRNLVYRDDIFDILILCWNKEQESAIHDHPENGCIVKILEGSLIEKVYDKSGTKLILTKKLVKGDISYQRGAEGLHNIVNEGNKCAVTIHVYSPPNYTPKFYFKLHEK